MDETGYCAGGRWRGRLPLGVSSPRMSLIGWPRRTLDCRHGEAVLAVEPGARRREYPFSGLSRRPPCLARERDGDVASTMCGIGRASEGDRGLPADCVRPKGLDRSWRGSRPRRRAFWRCRRGWPRPRSRMWRWRRPASIGSRSGPCCATTSAWFSPTPRTSATCRAARATPTTRPGSPTFSPTG